MSSSSRTTKLLLVCILLWSIVSGVSAAPLFSPTNTLWLKADSGVVGTTNVTSWIDQSGFSTVVQTGSVGTAPTLDQNIINFNPAVRIYDNGQSKQKYFVTNPLPAKDDMSMIAVFKTTQKEGTNDFWSSPLIIGGEIKSTAYDYGFWLSQWKLFLKATLSDSISAFTTGASLAMADNLPHIGIGTRIKSATGTVTTYVDGKMLISTGSDNNTLSGTISTWVNDPTPPFIGVGIGNTYYAYVGAPNYAAAQYNGNIAETLIYSSVLTATAKSQVDSYLALKYGITLDQTSPTNYIDSASNIVWKASDNIGYNKNIFWLGRDDTTGLNQKVSKSESSVSDILMLALENNFTLANTSTGRTVSHAQDRQYFIVANNGGSISTTTTESDGTHMRIGREWKVEKTANFTQEVYLSFTGYNSDWYLVVDTDGDFSSGTLYTSRLSASGTIGTSALTDGIYFTLMKELPPTDIALSNTTVPENSLIVGSLSGTDPDNDPLTFTLVTGTGDEDNSRFVISATGMLSFVSAPDYENPTDQWDTPANNTYSLRVRADDGRWGVFEKVFIITVTDLDEIPPTVEFTSTQTLFSGSTLTLNFSGSDNAGGSGIQKVQCQLDGTGGTWTDCTNFATGTTTLGSHTMNSVSDGQHILYVRAIDGANNTSTPTPYAFQVDTIAPIISAATADIDAGVNSPVLTFSGVDEAGGSGIKKWILIIDGGTPIELSGSVTSYTPTGLSGTSHIITFYLIDTAGNISTEKILRFPPSVTIIAPTIKSNTGITDSTVNITGPAGMSITSVTASGLNLPALDCGSLPKTVPFTCTIGAVLQTGVLEVVAHSVDGFDWTSSQQYLVDMIAPVVTISAPADLTVLSGSTTTLTFSGTDLGGTSIVWYECQINSGAWGACSGFTFTASGLIEWSNTVSIRATDEVGNVGTPATITLVRDSTPPTVTVNPLPFVDTSNQAATLLTGTCTAGDGNVVITLRDTTHTPPTDTSETTSCSASGTWTLTANLSSFPDGEKTIHIHATQSDAAGNIGTSNTELTDKDTTPPVITLSGSDMTVTKGSPTFVDPGYHCTDNYDPSCTVVASGSVDTSTVGTYTITYTAVDAHNNIATPKTRTITVVLGNPPVLTLIGSDTITLEAKTDTYAELGATATDTEDGDITANISQTGTVNTNLIGTYTIIYSVSDRSGNPATPITRTVKVVDTIAPTISGAIDRTITQWSVFDPLAGIVATDTYDGDRTKSITVSGSVNTAIPGTYTLVYTVKDTSGNITTKTVSITVAIASSSSGNGGGWGGWSSPIATVTTTPTTPIAPTTPTLTPTPSHPGLLPTQTSLTPSGTNVDGQQIFTLDHRLTDFICPKIVKVYDTDEILSTDIENTAFFDDARAVMMFRGLELDEEQFGQTYLEYKRFGIAINDRLFEPYRNVTRAEYVKMLVRALSCRYTYLGTDTPFPDVSEKMWYAEYIKFAVKQGWINGYQDGNFRPNAPVTRDEAAKILARAIRLETGNQDSTVFRDVPSTSEFIPYIETLRENNIFKGKTSTTFEPKSYIPRTEASRVVYRTFLGGK